MLPTELLLPLVLTLMYVFSTFNDLIFMNILKLTKVNVFLVLCVSAWVASFCNSMFGMNLYLVLLIVAVIIFSISYTLLYYKTKEQLNKVEEKFMGVDDVFKNKIGTVDYNVNGDCYMGEIKKDGYMQKILVYCHEKMEKGGQFVITDIKGDKIMAEKYVGTENANINTENNKEEK